MKVGRPIVVNTALAVVILAVAGGGVLVVTHPFSTSSAEATTQLTGTVQRGTVSATISASGSIAPVREVTSSFGVSGTIASVDVAPGTVVTAGQLLGTLDSTPLADQLASARSSLASATAQLASAKSALSASTTVTVSAQTPSTSGGPGAPSGGQSTSGSASAVAGARTQVTSAQAQLTTAQDAVDTASANLADATLTAPISGLVVAVSGAVGDTTAAGSAAEAVTPTGTTSSGTSGGGAGAASGFVTIADTSQLTVTADVAEADVAAVSVGQAASVEFPALSGTTATAKVTAIAPIATTANSVVTYPATITLDAIPSGLRLGQTAQVVITTRTSGSGVLYVPTAAITTIGGVSTVRVVAADGTTTPVTVTLGIAGDVGTVITGGLKAGQTVVIGTVAANTTNTGTQQGRFGTRGGFGGGPGTGAGTGAGPGGAPGFVGRPNGNG